tara:strand:+ start:84 stop:305 length:222 start_codon:yes stop_codon:yes gene_type:complete
LAVKAAGIGDLDLLLEIKEALLTPVYMILTVVTDIPSDEFSKFSMSSGCAFTNLILNIGYFCKYYATVVYAGL